MEGESVVGGGSVPGRTLPTALVAVEHPDPERLAAALRAGDPPIVGRIQDDVFVMDVRTIDPTDDDTVAAALAAAR
jgi:L-seryl-tRNA(Ser) seleniumtransferase